MTPAEALHEALSALPVEPDPHPDTLVPLVLAALREGAVERVLAAWRREGRLRPLRPDAVLAEMAVNAVLGPVE